jgi:hypothetical protein
MNNINLQLWVFKAKHWKESWCLAPMWSKNRAIDKETLNVIAFIIRFDRIGEGEVRLWDM